MVENAKSTQIEQLEQWANNAAVSVSASLVFGRDRAKEIAEPLLMVLFVMTANDYKKALEVIGKIESFPVKRIFLEQFKYCYILNTGSEEFSTLVLNTDFSNQQMADEYDSVLLKLLNENDKDFALVSEKLSALPIRAKRVAMKRIHSREFSKFRQIKIRPKQLLNNAEQPLIKTWYWVLITIVLAVLIIIKIE